MSLTAEIRVVGGAEEVSPDVVEIEELEWVRALSWLQGEYRAGVHWYFLPNGSWMLHVFDEQGNLVDGALGDDPVDALLEVAGRLMPPTAD